MLNKYINNNRCFVIAEAGVNHNGSLDNALKLVDIAKLAGADAVKFQTFNASELVTLDAPKAEYQKLNSESDEITQYDMLKKLELTKDMHLQIKQYCDSQNIIFISTPFDIKSVDLLEDIGVPIYKIGSGDLTNHQLLKYVNSKNKPIILSTGMATETEIQDSVKLLNKDNLVVLHCVSSYPTPINNTNLKCITTLQKNLNLPIGFSDHTESYEAMLLAIALGAKCIEKHFTLDKNMEGPDHKMSLNQDELTLYISKLRDAELMLGDGIKRCMDCELNTKQVARRSLAVNKDMLEGDVIREEDIISLRPESGILANKLDKIVGKRLTKNIKKYNILQNCDVNTEVKIGILVNVRLDSTRLPEKHLIYADSRTFLEWQVERIKKAINHANITIVIASSNKPRNQKLIPIVEKLGVELFFGSDSNIPLRHLQCAQKYNLTHIVSIDGDDILCSVSTIRDICEIVEYHDIIRSEGLPDGMNILWTYNIDILRRLNVQNIKELDTCWGYVFDGIPIYKIQSSVTHDKNIRLTLDYKEDATLFKTVIENFKNEILTIPDEELIKYINENHLDTINNKYM